MLEKIEYLFPKNNKSLEFFELLYTLLKNLSYVTLINKEEIHIISSNLKPETVFKLDDNINQIQFNIGEQKYLNLLNRNIKNNKKSNTIKKLSIQNVAKKLSGHVIRVDHTGINLPTNLYHPDEWKNLLNYLSSVSNLYNYPTGEPWPFLIPATLKENQSEITNFSLLREPRFELVYDAYTDTVALQIDIETNLSKSEVETLFPKDQGIYFPSLKDIFKTIYLDYSDFIDIRLDVRFQCLHDDFETGEWFVSSKRRILS